MRLKSQSLSFILIFLSLFLSGCAAFARYNLDKHYGSEDPQRFDRISSSTDTRYWQDIKPILEQRCVVCHACYDAPCQLKLESYTGLTRGANSTRVYNGARLLASEPTRLFEDAHSIAAWREKGFSPVLNERDNTAIANIDASVLAQMLLLKQKHPLPQGPILPETFDFRLNRDQQCAKIEDFNSFAEDYPLWGMPYGLPGLSKQEQQTILDWLRDGAPFQDKNYIPDTLHDTIRQWEGFLNQDSLQAQLMSRYIYEHLFLAHLFFAVDEPTVFFKLVRSNTPPGEPIDIISTRLPFDDPQTQRVYYRLQVVRETIVAKTHMPYKLDQARMKKWQTWFMKDDFQVTELPGYDSQLTSNPFVTFAKIPFRSRYRFMLDEAQFTIMGFIKGPVCRGETALNVINDHFWVSFFDPDLDYHSLGIDDIVANLHEINLPAESKSNASPLGWIKYAHQEQTYLDAKIAFMDNVLARKIPLNLNLLWNGDIDRGEKNDNASLTVYRHFDSATVLKGLVGERPQTAWVIDYPMLERIHYLLVAGYDVFGNVGHQLNTRIYMDFLRMEGEINFLLFLPKATRKQVRDHWYRGSVNMVEKFTTQRIDDIRASTSMNYTSQQPLQELYARLKTKLRLLQSGQYQLATQDDTTAKALATIKNLHGEQLAQLPQTTFIAVQDRASNNTRYYTLLRNNMYSNISHLFGEEERHLIEEDSVSLLQGIVGAYPNAFLSVDSQDIEAFSQAIQHLQSEQQYREFMDRFSVRRTAEYFWQFSDQIHRDYRKLTGFNFGILDYNRLENR